MVLPNSIVDLEKGKFVETSDGNVGLRTVSTSQSSNSGESTKSTGNSTNTPLNDGQTFTGTGELNTFPEVLVTVKTDQSGILYAEFSDDNSNWDSSLSYNVDADTNEIHRLVKGGRYFRARFTNNSGSNQTFIRLNTSYGSFNQLSSPLNGTIAQDGS